MKRFILTGAPGSGKTTILRQLERDGFSVVEEAATDLIAAAQLQGKQKPWTEASFIDEIAQLQRDRQVRSSLQQGEIQFHDRSAVCTAALAVFLGYPISTFLSGELDRIQKEAIYEHQVFFIRNLGFVTPTSVRQIGFEDTLRLETIHEEIYRGLGFELINIAAVSHTERVNPIKAAIEHG